jgi:hypothetical protein
MFLIESFDWLVCTAGKWGGSEQLFPHVTQKRQSICSQAMNGELDLHTSHTY